MGQHTNTCWSPLLTCSPCCDPARPDPAGSSRTRGGGTGSPSSSAWHPRCSTPGLLQVGQCTTGGKRWLSFQKSPAFGNSEKQTLTVQCPLVLPVLQKTAAPQAHHKDTAYPTDDNNPYFPEQGLILTSQGCTQGCRFAPVCPALSPRPHPPWRTFLCGAGSPPALPAHCRGSLSHPKLPP